jgi:hypothetical protein
MKAPILAELQTQFQDFLLSPAPDDDTIPMHPVQAAIASQFGLPADQRLAIYYHAYRIRLQEAMAESFDKTYTYLGDDLFAQMIQGYIADHPSTWRNLRWYGADFPAHLADALADHPVVAELAAFEWSLGLAFDAADAPNLAADDLRALEPQHWGQIGFDLHPSVQFLQVQSNAPAVWLALEQEQTPPDVQVESEPVSWLVWRKQLQPHFRSLSRFETIALQGLQAGLSFAVVCEAAVQDAGEVDITTQMAGWLQAWLTDEILRGYRL